MGAWDVGPFDNDAAADFAATLDEASLEERKDLVHCALKRAANTTDFLRGPDGMLAVAAAALIVAQCPGGEPACPIYGPSEPMPEFSLDLRMWAIDALDQVAAKSSELAELWDEAADGPQWRQAISRLRDVLDPPIPPQEEVLFEI